MTGGHGQAVPAALLSRGPLRPPPGLGLPAAVRSLRHRPRGSRVAGGNAVGTPSPGWVRASAGLVRVSLGAARSRGTGRRRRGRGRGRRTRRPEDRRRDGQVAAPGYCYGRGCFAKVCGFAERGVIPENGTETL